MIGRFTHFLAKRRALRRYMTELPRRLFGDYGHTGPYTPQQVLSTIKRYRISSPNFAHVAIAPYCDRAAVQKWQRDEGISYDIAGASAEMGGTYFGGNAFFTFSDVTHHLSSHGHDAAHGHDGDGHGGD